VYVEKLTNNDKLNSTLTSESDSSDAEVNYLPRTPTNATTIDATTADATAANVGAFHSNSTTSSNNNNNN
jgi:hypothetical protein